MDALKGVIARNDIRVEQKSIGRELDALEREEAEAQRSRWPASDGLDWTDRAGMVAQEASAMKAFRDRQVDAAPVADAPLSSKPEPEADARRARFAKMFERKPDDPGSHVADPDRSQGRDDKGGHSR
jgi:hypothetical protein